MHGACRYRNYILVYLTLMIVQSKIAYERMFNLFCSFSSPPPALLVIVFRFLCRLAYKHTHPDPYIEPGGGGGVHYL